MAKLDLISKLLLPLFLPVFLLDFLLCLLSNLINPPENAADEMKSVAVGKPTDTHGAPRRSPKIKNGELMTAFDHAATLYELTQHAIKKFGNRVAMQHYEFLSLKKKKETDRFPSKQFGDNLIQVTYKELDDKIRNFGKGMRQMGMESQPKDDVEFDEKKGKFTLVIFEETCKEWTMAFQAAMSQSMVVATCYATLGEDAVVSAVSETGASALMVNWKDVEKFHKAASQMPTLEAIIASTHEMPKDATIWKPKDKSNVQVVSFDEVMDMGKGNNYEPVPPRVSNISAKFRYYCCLVITSLIISLSKFVQNVSPRNPINNITAIRCGCRYVHIGIYRKAKRSRHEAFPFDCRSCWDGNECSSSGRPGNICIVPSLGTYFSIAD